MPTPTNSIEIFNTQGEIFPSISANNVKTTGFDFYFSNGNVFDYLLQPLVTIAATPSNSTTLISNEPIKIKLGHNYYNKRHNLMQLNNDFCF